MARQADHATDEQGGPSAKRLHGKQQGRDVDDGAQHPKSRQSLIPSNRIPSKNPPSPAGFFLPLAKRLVFKKRRGRRVAEGRRERKIFTTKNAKDTQGSKTRVLFLSADFAEAHRFFICETLRHLRIRVHPCSSVKSVSFLNFRFSNPVHLCLLSLLCFPVFAFICVPF